jgi:hypothetical protein
MEARTDFECHSILCRVQQLSGGKVLAVSETDKYTHLRHMIGQLRQTPYIPFIDTTNLSTLAASRESKVIKQTLFPLYKGGPCLGAVIISGREHSGSFVSVIYFKRALVLGVYSLVKTELLF